MGHKSNPIGLRLQINRTWDSRWYADGADYGRLLLEDLKIRKHIMSPVSPSLAAASIRVRRNSRAFATAWASPSSRRPRVFCPTRKRANRMSAARFSRRSSDEPHW